MNDRDLFSTSAHAREQFGRLRAYVERLETLKGETNSLEQKIRQIAEDVLRCGLVAAKLPECYFRKVCAEQFDFEDARRFIGANIDKPSRILKIDP